MKRHKVTRKLKSGKTITYWRGKGEGKSAPTKGEEFAKKKEAKSKEEPVTEFEEKPKYVDVPEEHDAVGDFKGYKRGVGREKIPDSPLEKTNTQQENRKKFFKEGYDIKGEKLDDEYYNTKVDRAKNRNKMSDSDPKKWADFYADETASHTLGNTTKIKSSKTAKAMTGSDTSHESIVQYKDSKGVYNYEGGKKNYIWEAKKSKKK